MNRFLFVLLLSLPLLCRADEANIPTTPKNRVKLNLLSLPMRCFSLGYERQIHKNIGVGLGVRFQPAGGLPFKNIILNNIGESSITARDFVNNSNISNWAVTPEIRYYFGKRPLSGFYTGMFVRYGQYNIGWAYRFTDDNGLPHTYQLKGNADALSGGILLGVQFNLPKNFYIDWQIAGPHLVMLKAKLEATGDFRDLDQFERQRLKNMLQGFAINDNHLAVEITDSHINGNMNLNTAGFRTAFSIGYKF